MNHDSLGTSHARRPSLGVVYLAAACGLVTVLSQACSGDSGAPDGGGANASTGAMGTASTASNGPSGGTGGFDACGGKIVDPATGAIDAAEYAHQARLWDRVTIDCRLGPKFTDLHPGEADQSPTAYEPPHQTGGVYHCPTFELSGTCEDHCDTGSTSGQVLYAPSDPTATGVDRVQSYAYDQGVICESPLSGGWLGGNHPDPGLAAWTSATGRPELLPNGFSQTEMWETNAGIMIFPDGLVGATGNQTAGDTKPWFQLPANKVPTAVSVTSYNEFAFVTIWDTDAMKGQVAVFALRAFKPEAFTVPYFALPNEAGFTAIHLMGYVDLPDMKTPTAIAVSGDNGNTPGGHTIGFEFGSSDPDHPEHNIMTSADARNAFEREDYERWVPMAGQAVVASRWENEVTFLDLRPLMQFVREVYFGPDDAKRQAAASAEAWPFTFETNPEAMPLVVTTIATPHPTVVRIQNQHLPWGPDLSQKLKAFVGNLDGEVRLFDVTAFAQDAPRPVPPESVVELGVAQAGRNLTSMTFRGWDDIIVSSRGDKEVDWMTVDETDGVFKVVRTLKDSRMGDPVVVDASDRGPVVTIGDFTGNAVLNFRYAKTEGNPIKPPANYGCGPDGSDAECTSFEFGGQLAMPGSVFFIGTSNVN